MEKLYGSKVAIVSVVRMLLAQSYAEYEVIVVSDGSTDRTIPLLREAYDLELTGPAGGHWRHGQGEHITMDALEFCRTLSGRAPAEGLLRTQVPF